MWKLAGLLVVSGCVGLAPKPVGSAPVRAIVVRTADWAATTGTLERFERGASGWARVGEPMNVVVGRKGLGWGYGLHGLGGPRELGGPNKLEGDGRAPAGVFRVWQTYGRDAAAPQGLLAPYTALTPTMRCVNDLESTHYAQLVDEAQVKADWKSAEPLFTIDGYERFALIEHNTTNTTTALGSCIFLHRWKDAETPTSGCTALDAAPLDEVLKFIERDGTVLIQLPAPIYAQLKAPWGLP